MVFHDPAGIFLRPFAGVFGGDGVKCFLVNQMLGGSRERGEADAEAQKDFHADEGTGNGRFGEWFARLAAGLQFMSLRSKPLIGIIFFAKWLPRL
jgi:hypothetical protein